MDKFKKQIVAFIVCQAFLFNNPALAQVPQGFSYQAVIRNSNGDIIASQQVKMRFSIKDSLLNGTIFYQEEHELTTSQLGLVVLTVGTGVPVKGLFKNIPWSRGLKFMEVEIDISNTGNYVTMGANQMQSVPYALFSGNMYSDSNTTINKRVITQLYINH